MPATVASGPLFEIVVPVSPRMMPAGAAVKVAWLGIVRTGNAVLGAGKGMVRVPRMRAERPKETWVPLRVAAGAARVRVVEGRTSWVGRMVSVVPEDGSEVEVEVTGEISEIGQRGVEKRVGTCQVGIGRC